MLAGINSAIAEYAAKARLMADRRIRARVFNASGVGRIVHAASYDYSVSICEVTPEACSVYEYDGLMQIGEDGIPIPQGPSPGINLWGVGDITQEWLDGGGADLLAHNSTPYSVVAELNSPTFRWLEQANSLYLAPAFKAFRSIYLRTGITAIDDCLLFLNLLVPTFLTSFTLLMIFVFLPHIKATNEDIQIKRAILLYLPGQVIRDVPTIRRLVESILAEDTVTALLARAQRSAGASAGD